MFPAQAFVLFVKAYYLRHGDDVAGMVVMVEVKVLLISISAFSVMIQTYVNASQTIAPQTQTIGSDSTTEVSKVKGRFSVQRS
jgi:hypothetical protein